MSRRWKSSVSRSRRVESAYVLPPLTFAGTPARQADVSDLAGPHAKEDAASGQPQRGSSDVGVSGASISLLACRKFFADLVPAPAPLRSGVPTQARQQQGRQRRHSGVFDHQALRCPHPGRTLHLRERERDRHSGRCRRLSDRKSTMDCCHPKCKHLSSRNLFFRSSTANASSPANLNGFALAFE